MQAYLFPSRHRPGKKEILNIACGLGILMVVAMIFYQSLLAVVFMLPLMLPILRRNHIRQEEKRRRDLTVQFRELMNSVLSAMRAGYSAENAFREGYDDMVFLYGSDAPVSQGLLRICRGLDSHIPLERLLKNFAEDSEVEEIMEFADVFTIAKRSGGDMAQILGRCARQIQNRLDVETEISLLMSARRMEQRIMDVVPFFIILYIGMTSRGFFNVLYHNLPGMIIMTICLLVYILAFYLSERIVAIRV